MIPTAFDYAAPSTVEEAVSVLSQAGDDAKVLAGGHSLIPVLRLRLAGPEVVIDLNRIDSLRGVRDDGDALLIGSMTTHHQIASDPLIAEHASLIAEATRMVADPQVRHRGTIGGSLVHADPAGDLGAPALALGAEFHITGAQGSRVVPAEDYFVDLFTTAVSDDEVLTHIRVPKYTGWGADYQKFVRVAQQWSIAAVGAAVRTDGGTIAEARIGLTNMGSTPLRPQAVEQALVGCTLNEEAVRAATGAVADGTNPPTDLNGDAEYRRHLAGVLCARAVLAAGTGTAGGA